MKIIKTRIYEGRNIYSHRRCMRIDLDLEGYCNVPSKNIEGFNFELINIIPELMSHRCGIDEDEGFVKRLDEGTYLAHICEHMILAIQNKIGLEVSYGKSREILDDHYYIITEYIYPQVAVEISVLAVDIINNLIMKKFIDFDKRLDVIKRVLNSECIGESTEEICNSAKEMGLPVVKLGEGSFYQIGYGKQGRMIEASIVSTTSCVAVDIASDKLLTKEILDLHNIPVAQGCKVYNVIGLLKQAEEIGYPLVLKPQYGNQGKAVILDIQNEKELVASYEKVSSEFNDIILERYYEGNDYRVCVVDYKVIAVTLRKPPFVIGDGKSTILELINDLNSNPLRGEDHEKPLTKIKIDSEIVNYLKINDLTLYSILEKNYRVNLRRNANLSTGGYGEDCTDVISKENIELCIRTAKALSLNLCGIDICTRDISKSLNDDGIVIEVNAAPGLRMHTKTTSGACRKVGKEIVNMIYQGNPTNIPVIAITGTNGKTTTTRIISHVINKIGYCVGMTSTDGIYINNKCIDKGDDTGYKSARCVLLNKDVDVAVLETARGGIIKRGLAYDLADVAVITNITEDHLGIDDINTMEELCYVKSLVAEAVKDDGYVVINADDKWSHKIIHRIKSKIIFFSKTKENRFIQEGIRRGGIVLYIENDYIIANNKGISYKICKSKELPITLEGTLHFNIENILAASAALVAMKVDYCMIKNGLVSYELNSDKNSGRFNVYDISGVNVILDYGHNVEGYKAVLKSIQRITKGKKIGVIGIPGDRMDSMAMDIGKVASELLDEIIIKEDEYKRGRKEGEVAKLVLEGIKLSGKDKPSKVILNEVEAFKYALKNARRGDSVVVFFEKLDPLLNVLNELEYLNSYQDFQERYLG